MERREFLWCCGIEDTFIGHPHPRTKKRLDEYELTDHYTLWREDFDRVASLGVDALRWGIPWYRVQPSPTQWEWDFVDEALDYLVNEVKVNPILDLMHYGTPIWLDDALLHPDYPQWVEEYTARVIERYGHLLTHATPFNEPHTAAEFAGRRGQWPPYRSDYTGYFAVYLNVMRGTLRQTRLLQQADIACVQVECSGGSFARSQELSEQALVDTTVQSMFFDFLIGDMDALKPIIPFMRAHGVSDKDLSFFSTQATGIDIMGVNFYPQFSFQDIELDGSGEVQRKNSPLWTDDLMRILRQRYETYKVPMMITETSVRDDTPLKEAWLLDSTTAVYEAYLDGLPVYGYTWFPVIDMYDWEYRVQEGEKDEFKACFGFYNQAREEYCGAPHYRAIIERAKRNRV